MHTKFLQIIFLSTLLCSATNALRAQTKTPDPAMVELKVFHNALSINDLGTAIQSLHYIIASDSVKYGNYEDTLAILYTQINAFSPAYILSNRLLAQKGYTEIRMQIKGVAAKNLNEPIEAINAYNDLFSRTNNPVYGMEQLQLEYSIRRLAESVATGNKVLAAIPANDSTQVRMAKLQDKTMQLVSLRAAVHNVLGLAYLDLKDKKSAIINFEEALKETPDFDQAKNNLAVANAMAADSTKQN